MKTKIFLFMLLLLIFGLSCEPQGGGVGYQYLGLLKAVQFNCDSNNNYTTTLKIDNNSFTVVGKIIFKERNCTYIWVNISKNTLRIRQHNVTSEHSILEWKTLDWRVK